MLHCQQYAESNKLVLDFSPLRLHDLSQHFELVELLVSNYDYMETLSASENQKMEVQELGLPIWNVAEKTIEIVVPKADTSRAIEDITQIIDENLPISYYLSNPPLVKSPMRPPIYSVRM